MNRTSLTLLIFGALFLQTGQTNASRLMKVPPLYFETVHGAFINGSTYCISADVDSNASLGGAVSTAYHLYQINCHGDSGQKVRFHVLGDSLIASANTAGTPNGSGAPGNALGPWQLSTPYVSAEYEVSGKGTLTHTISIHCSSHGCTLKDGDLSSSTIILGVSANHWTGIPQTCISVTSLIYLEIEARDTSGSLTCSAVGKAHRSSGIKDKYLTPPPSFAVAGGRAF